MTRDQKMENSALFSLTDSLSMMVLGGRASVGSPNLFFGKWEICSRPTSRNVSLLFFFFFANGIFFVDVSHSRNKSEPGGEFAKATAAQYFLHTKAFLWWNYRINLPTKKATAQNPLCKKRRRKQLELERPPTANSQKKCQLELGKAATVVVVGI